jgi:prophage maintenance system killer protein
MKNLDDKSKNILEFVKENPSLSSKEIHEGKDWDISYATLKRKLTKLISGKLILPLGKGRGRKYVISPSYNLFFPINILSYFEKEVDERKIVESYNFPLISEVFEYVTLFTESELQYLNNLQNKYLDNISMLSKSMYNKELERLAIDLSWKSSQIEGNTYSLLETERLLKEKETAAGKSKDEAVMLLNHKDAIDFIVNNPMYTDPISISKIEDIHSILIKEMEIDRNIRKRRVGISGTNYKPLDNEFQIKEALRDMCRLVNNRKIVFESALLLLILISYIQPFSDGNKRTARIISNAILINNKYCPISFRTIDSVDFKKAMLIFYEQNNLTAIKDIFIHQFEFSVKTYF